MQDEIQQAVAEELGIEGLTSEEQQELITQMTGIMLKAASVAVVEKLPADKREEFVTISNKKDDAALAAFLQAELPNSEEVVRGAIAEEIRRFKEFQASLPTK